MINHEYCSEIEGILAQFMAAIDDGAIIRQNKDRKMVVSGGIILSGVQPVYHEIINSGKTATLPMIVVEPQSISYKPEFEQNKRLENTVVKGFDVYSYRQPVPIQIKVNVVFIARYFGDMYQMFSNIASFSQPYHILATQVPTDFKTSEEIRTKATWDGSFNIEYPKE